MNHSALPFTLAGALLLAAAYGGWKVWQVNSQEQTAASSASPIILGSSKGLPVKDFALTRSTGEEFRSSDLKGEVWVASFFFTTCPGTCKRLNTNIRLLQEDEALSDVRWISISVDPVTDTLEALKQYSTDFDADPERWFFLRGELNDVRSIGRENFKLPVNLKGHNDYGVVIDRMGVIRGLLNINSRRDRTRLQELLVELLAEPMADAEEDTDAAQNS